MKYNPYHPQRRLHEPTSFSHKRDIHRIYGALKTHQKISSISSLQHTNEVLVFGVEWTYLFEQIHSCVLLFDMCLLYTLLLCVPKGGRNNFREGVHVPEDLAMPMKYAHYNKHRELQYSFQMVYICIYIYIYIGVLLNGVVIPSSWA